MQSYNYLEFIKSILCLHRVFFIFRFDISFFTMSKSQTTFQMSWKIEFPWVEQDKKPFYATCKICKGKSFSFKSMGRSALKSHARSKKHKDLRPAHRFH